MSYRIGVIVLELFLPDAHSLKDKRSIVRSLVAKIRQRFNVSVAEIGHQELWQRTVIVVAVVSASAAVADKSLTAILGMVEANLTSGHVVSAEREML
ncbi:MAG: hypothetical protein DDT20_00285 [Firmicutes bacterium]|nr:hypothetical protein [Bacillota bacterium]